MKIRFNKLKTSKKTLTIKIGNSEPMEYNVKDIRTNGIEFNKAQSSAPTSITIDDETIYLNNLNYIQTFYKKLPSSESMLLEDCRLSALVCDRFNLDNPLGTNKVPGNYYINDIEGYQVNRKTKSLVTFDYSSSSYSTNNFYYDFEMFKSDAVFLTAFNQGERGENSNVHSVRDEAMFWTYSHKWTEKTETDLPASLVARINGPTSTVMDLLGNSFNNKNFWNYSTMNLEYNKFWSNSSCIDTDGSNENPQPARFCTDETISFNGSGSYYDNSLVSPNITKNLNLSYNSYYSNSAYGFSYAYDRLISDIAPKAEQITITDSADYYSSGNFEPISWWDTSSDANLFVTAANAILNCPGTVKFNKVELSSIINHIDYEGTPIWNVDSSSIISCYLDNYTNFDIINTLTPGTKIIFYNDESFNCKELLDLNKISFTSDSSLSRYVDLRFNGLKINSDIDINYWNRSYSDFNSNASSIPQEGFWYFSFASYTFWNGEYYIDDESSTPWNDYMEWKEINPLYVYDTYYSSNYWVNSYNGNYIGNVSIDLLGFLQYVTQLPSPKKEAILKLLISTENFRLDYLKSNLD